MKFYDCSTAPSPRRARMFIAEKGVEIETQDINLREAEQLSAAFKAINPRATTPVLVTDGGTKLTENIAIAVFLEKMFPEPPLLGTSPDETGSIFMWNAIVEQQGLMAIAETLRNSNPHMKDRALPGVTNFAQIPELAERGRVRVGLFFDTIEEQLSQSEYLAGDTFSLADITAYICCDFTRVIRMTIPDGNTATRAWFDRIAERPSANF